MYDESRNGFSTEKAMIRGRFRCDTFVIYCYEKAFQRDVILDGGLGFPKLPTPLTVFNTFVYQRNDVLPDINVLPPETSGTLDQNNLSDEHLHDYLRNVRVLRQEKLNYLLKTAQQGDMQTFSYLMDTLASFGAHEIIPDLTQAFANEDVQEKRKKLITAVTVSAFKHVRESAEGIESPNVGSIRHAQHFVVQLLREERDPLILRHTILHALSILPMNSANYALVSQAIDRVQAQSAQEYHFTDEQKFFLLLTMAFANNDMQNSLLPELLSRPLSVSEKTVFDEQLFFVITQLLPSDVIFAARAGLKDRIAAANNSTSGDKLFAFATVEHDTIEGRNNELVALITNEKNSLLQAKSINNLDITTLLQISPEIVENVYFKLQRLLEQTENARERHIYSTAISKLSTLLKSPGNTEESTNGEKVVSAAATVHGFIIHLLYSIGSLVKMEL